MKTLTKHTRKLYLIGDIDEEMYKEFAEKLADLEAESSKPVKVDLHSSGGDSYSGIAIFSRIRTSSCPIHITCYGAAHSAASIILPSASYRVMSKDAWMLIHDDAANGLNDLGHQGTLQAELSHKDRLENMWADILSRFSTKNKEYFRELSKKTTYLSAQECLELGLIDKII